MSDHAHTDHRTQRRLLQCAGLAKFFVYITSLPNFFFFFFLNNPAPPNFSPFPHPAPLPFSFLFLQPPPPAVSADDEFFEKKIRPVLVENCFGCHSDKAPKLKGSLKLDSRAAILKGGDSGPAVALDAPDQSLILRAISYKDTDLQMPPRGKLPDATIPDL